MFHRLISVLTILLVLSISLSIMRMKLRIFLTWVNSFMNRKISRSHDAFENARLTTRLGLVYSKLGQIYLQAGETDQAIQFFQESICLEPNSDIFMPISLLLI